MIFIPIVIIIIIMIIIMIIMISPGALQALMPLGEGQRIGLVGPAGTGKSKAAQMLLSAQREAPLHGSRGSKNIQKCMILYEFVSFYVISYDFYTLNYVIILPEEKCCKYS